MSTPHTDSAPAKGLFGRAIGVITSPRATYGDIAAHPKVLGALVAVVVLIGSATFAFMSTEIGQRAVLDQQITTMEGFGVKVTDQMIANMESRVSRGAYVAVAAQAVFIPLVAAVMAGLLIVVFNAILGGEATFKQVYAIVVHSAFISALQTLFVMPLNYAKESMSSATSLLVFLPMVDDQSFLGLALGSIDLFRVWSIVSLAIGLAVLYRRRTSPVAWSLLGLYVVIVLAVAGVRAALSGA